MLELSLGLIAALMAAAFVAGVIDAIAGGGGLITVPALILAGAPPVTAIGTNKIQGACGAATSAYSYARAGHVDPRSQLKPAAIAFVASMAGAGLIAWLPVDAIRLGLPPLLIAIALFFALKPGLDDVDRAQRVTPALFAATAVPLIAAYDGLLGPGAGAFYMLAFVSLAGFGVLRAVAHTKVLNLASNLGSLLILALVADVWWGVGLAMALGQIAGARVGARLAMRVGARIVKPVLVVTSVALALRLAWDWV